MSLSIDLLAFILSTNIYGKRNVSERMNEQQKAYLFPWNPVKFPWSSEELDAQIAQIDSSGEAIDQWRCVSYKKAKVGDRAFLVMVGPNGRGIFGSGYISEMPDPDEVTTRLPLVSIAIDILLNPHKQPILSLDVLSHGKLSKQCWTPQSPGISIRPELLEELEMVWEDFLVDSEQVNL